MTTPENKDTQLIVKVIYRLYPNLAIVMQTLAELSPITINLPITREVYTQLLRGIAQPNFYKRLPLIFFVNEKGIAYKICSAPKKEIVDPSPSINATFTQ